MESLTAYINGISTVPTLLDMPTTILFAQSTSPLTPNAAYTTESLNPALSSILASYDFPSVLSYTVSASSGNAVATSSPDGSTPIAPATYFNSNGSAVVTSLPASRFASSTAASTTIATFVPSLNSTRGGNQQGAPPYNPNAAPSISVTRNGVLVLALACSVALL